MAFSPVNIQAIWANRLFSTESAGHYLSRTNNPGAQNLGSCPTMNCDSCLNGTVNTARIERHHPSHCSGLPGCSPWCPLWLHIPDAQPRPPAAPSLFPSPHWRTSCSPPDTLSLREGSRVSGGGDGEQWGDWRTGNLKPGFLGNCPLAGRTENLEI
jgi:hypothetical protein